MICNILQEDGRVNLVLPGSLMQFNKEIKEIFRREKASLLASKRFSQIFSNIQVGHVFSNNANLKKLIVRTKVS